MEPASKESLQKSNAYFSSEEMASVMSYSSSSGGSGHAHQGHRRLGAKMEVVYSLLGMLGSTEGRDDMSATLLAMSNSIDSCLVMRQSGCLPLLVQLIHAPNPDPKTRERASRALHNIIHSRSDEKIGRREARVLRLLEQIREYCHVLRMSLEAERPPDDLERHPGPTIAALMKLSFDEAHRHAMCQLGGLHAIAELIEMDHAAHESDTDDQSCITLRRYAGMALTNLTFGDGNNKALLCSFREFMKALVSQLRSLSDDLRQVTASVLRNLSWRADSSSKQTLREVGAVSGLMRAAMEGRKESTLKSILSALWNLSAHCSTNKVDICGVEGALAFLVDMLSYKAPSKTLSIIENAGGILRNVSSHIAMREDYRAIVRERGCLQVLLKQLRSPSLTVVSNACGALWNLSARCPHDQRLLWDLGAVPMLRSLVHSKHKMISMGSSAALKNLLAARPSGSNLIHLDSTARGLGLSTLPSLITRRQRALEQEIDQNLAETCENIEPSTSPINKDDKFSFKNTSSFGNIRRNAAYRTNQTSSGLTHSGVSRSESRESMRSVTSSHSDTIFERVHRRVSSGLIPAEQPTQPQSSSLHSVMGNFNSQGVTHIQSKTNQLDKKYALCYKNTTVERNLPTQLNVNNIDNLRSTMSWAAVPDQEAIEDKLSHSESVKLLRQINDKIPSGSCSPVAFFMANTLLSSGLTQTSEEDYAETDLDEPTNYSLRYAEHNSDEDERANYRYFQGNEQLEDTVITYDTEGTPRETSLNSSRAASEPDLQDEKTKLSAKTDACAIDQLSRAQSPKPQNIPLNSLEDPDINFKIRLEQKISEGLEAENETPRASLVISDGAENMNTLQLQEYQLRTGQSAMTPENYAVPTTSDEDLLAACIHIGMQNNRHRQSFRRNSLEKAMTLGETNLTRYQTSTTLDQFENLNVLDDEQEPSILNIAPKSIENFESTVGVSSIEDNLDTNDEKNSTKCLSHKLKIESPLIERDNDINELAVQYRPIKEHLHLSKPLNSTNMESYNSIEKSEQVLLELCIKSSTSNTENFQSKKFVDKTDGSSTPRESSNKNNDQEESAPSPVKQKKDEYLRQRDPDAMIASLDRLTATLVQQTEAMRERDFLGMKQSVHSDTWNEDSPNDLSFPTISMSVPLITSFNSETLPNIMIEQPSITPQTIEHEPQVDPANFEFSLHSLACNNLDAIKPPSTMNSLVSLSTSYIDNSESNDATITLSPVLSKARTSCTQQKKIPVGVVAKRALGHHHTTQKSLECLINDTSMGTISQLENVKPPSMMDELLDIGDMENSMLSVASITSEIADSKNSLFDLGKPSSERSVSEYLENINPPSLFNEIGEIDEVSIDFTDNTLCTSDTLHIKNELQPDTFHSILVDRTGDNDTDDATTPIPTEYSASSSAESTPKKEKQHLTPKEKRQLAKERYRTYTIAPELGKQEEECNLTKLESRSIRVTPKQRRQEDPARFQTQVLNNPCVNHVQIDQPQVSNIRPPSQNFKSTFSKQTLLSENISTDDMQTMIERNANIILDTMSVPRKIDDSLLDCETISLVSNDSEADVRVRLGNANKFLTFTKKNIQKFQQEPELVEIPKPQTPENEDIDHAEDPADSESDDQNECQLPEEPKRPRIIKPGNTDSNNEKPEVEIGKAIHGRRRALYSSPNTKRATSQSSPVKTNHSSGIPVGRGNTSPVVRTTRAITLRQNSIPTKEQSNVTQRVPSATRNTVLSKRSSIPQRNSAIASTLSVNRHSSPPEYTLAAASKEKVDAIKPLERQGTFTKDEPEMGTAPTVILPSSNKSKIAKPVRGSPSKIFPGKSKISIRTSQVSHDLRLTKCASADGIVSPRTASTLSNKRLSGLENLKTWNDNPQKIKRVLGPRSISNSSIVAPNSIAAGKKLPKEATSKIANLWKKVEESKNKQKLEPDTRQWITSSNSVDVEDAASSGTSDFRLFRSSTFEGIPKTTAPAKMKIKKSVKPLETPPGMPNYRNSCDLTGVNANDAPCKIPVRLSEKSTGKSTETYGTIVLRKQRSIDSTDVDPPKRLSRLGSFISVESTESHEEIQAPSSFASTTVPTLNKQNSLNKSKTVETAVPLKKEMVTVSSRITTV